MNLLHELNEEAWSEWVEYRTREKKKKIGPMAERKQQKFLTQYPPPIQQEIVDASIMNSWQGLFPPKEQKKQTNTAAAMTNAQRYIESRYKKPNGGLLE